MYFINYLHSYECVAKLIKSHMDVDINMQNIHTAYREVIAIYREIPPPKSGYSVSFEDGELGKYIKKTGIFDEIFTGVKESNDVDRARFKKLTEKSLALLMRIDERLFSIVNLLVTDIVYLKAEREGGGSASHLPGVICISPGEKWDEGDIVESIMHEATHLNLFVSDMVNGLFEHPLEYLEKPESRVVSAVRVGQMRPLDKAFHSAAVAVPLMYIQNKQGKSGLVDLFTESLRVCTMGLKDKYELFSPYGKKLVDQLYDFSVAQDFGKIEEAIGSKSYAHY